MGLALGALACYVLLILLASTSSRSTRQRVQHYARPWQLARTTAIGDHRRGTVAERRMAQFRRPAYGALRAYLGGFPWASIRCPPVPHLLEAALKMTGQQARPTMQAHPGQASQICTTQPGIVPLG